MVTAATFSAVCAVAVVVLLLAEFRHWAPLRAVSKITASTAFVGLALQQQALASAYGRGVLAALILSWFGDVLLLSRRSRIFLLGLAAFLLAHLAFTVAFAQHPLALRALAVGLLLMTCVALAVQRWLWRRLSGLYKPAVGAYLSALVVMCAFATADSAASGTWMTALAAYAFAASDVFVASHRFVDSGFVNKLFGLPLYYAAQLVFALSVAPI